jgi:hypothetical protein
MRTRKCLRKESSSLFSYFFQTKYQNTHVFREKVREGDGNVLLSEFGGWKKAIKHANRISNGL